MFDVVLLGRRSTICPRRCCAGGRSSAFGDESGRAGVWHSSTPPKRREHCVLPVSCDRTDDVSRCSWRSRFPIQRAFTNRSIEKLFRVVGIPAVPGQRRRLRSSDHALVSAMRWEPRLQGDLVPTAVGLALQFWGWSWPAVISRCLSRCEWSRPASAAGFLYSAARRRRRPSSAARTRQAARESDGPRTRGKWAASRA